MGKKETQRYFPDPWSIASKEEAEGYLRNAGIDPEAVKKEFRAFIDLHEEGKKLRIAPACR